MIQGAKRHIFYLDAEDLFQVVETLSHLDAKARVFVFWPKKNSKNFMITQKLKKHWFQKIMDSKSFMNPKKR